MNLRYIPLFFTALAYAQPQLTLRIATEVVAVGGWAQIKVYADSPKLISKGTLAIDLDPQVFGPIESIAAFSAAGDVAGLARVVGNHVTASFATPSGGLGQLPGLPVFTVRAPVLASAPSGGFIALSLPPTPLIRTSPNLYPQDAWTDGTGRPYTATLLSGYVQVGGTASIRNVSPQGFQAAGAILHVDGTGFTPTTKLRAEALSFTSTFISPTRIDLTLASSAELTGVRFSIDEPGRTVEFFSAVPSAVTPFDALSALPPANHVIFPITEGTATSNSRPTTTLGSQSVLFNPAPLAIEIRVTERATINGSTRTSQFLLEPGIPVSYTIPGSLIVQTLESDTPFRAVAYYTQGVDVGGARAGITNAVPSLSLLANAASQRPGTIAPGEFVTLRGTGLGTVWFNNIAAPVLYASPEQWNVIVPYELEGATTATVRMSNSKTWTVAVTPVAPGIFTLDATGIGRGAVLNQDNSVNSPDKAAATGTVIQIFATGGGQSNPVSTTGSITPLTGGGLNRLPVKVFFADTEATVTFAGPAPGFASCPRSACRASSSPQLP
jgi:uncharacterized protein (TIGR03437 family)